MTDFEALSDAEFLTDEELAALELAARGTAIYMTEYIGDPRVYPELLENLHHNFRNQIIAGGLDIVRECRTAQPYEPLPPGWREAYLRIVQEAERYRATAPRPSVYGGLLTGPCLARLRVRPERSGFAWVHRWGRWIRTIGRSRGRVAAARPEDVASVK